MPSGEPGVWPRPAFYFPCSLAMATRIRHRWYYVVEFPKRKVKFRDQSPGKACARADGGGRQNWWPSASVGKESRTLSGR